MSANVFGIYLETDDDYEQMEAWDEALKQFDQHTFVDTITAGFSATSKTETTELQKEISDILYSTQGLIEFTDAIKREYDRYIRYVINTYAPGVYSYPSFAVKFKNDADAVQFKLMTS